MKRKWKRLSSMCLAALLVLMMPVSINATEEGWETGTFTQETDSDSTQGTEVVEDQDTLDVVEQDVLQDDSDVAAMVEIQDDVQDDSVIEDSEPVSEPIYTASDFDSTPIVELKYQGLNYTQSLDIEIEYRLFINNHDQSVSISVSQGSLASLSYYLDDSGSTESKSVEQLSLLWQDAENIPYQEIKLNQDGKYVLYVKAVTNSGQPAYIKTVGMVVDTVAPVITGIQDGGTYPIGTKFGVEDANLAEVLVNEQVVSPSDDGLYQVVANGTSCVIKANDKADNKTTYSITIGEEKPVDPDNPDKPDNPDNPDNPDKPGDDITVINSNGTYSLHAGTAYRLGSGDWTLQGDSVVYKGGITFYVNSDGDYIFKKR